MWPLTIILALAGVTQIHAGGGNGGLPVDKVYGVNLGGWLILEPWMLPNEWVQMGGELCFQGSHCADCVGSEFALVQKLGQEQADAEFQKHWETWFTENDVRNIVDAKLNTVRIPIGYWIIEPLVNRETEFYPRGGIKQLKRGVQQLKSAGINVLLDFHAMPGVSSVNSSFAGRCTGDVEFYTPPNYLRALEWAAVTTFIAHVDSDFSSVFGIEAVNEPIMNPAMTPGYGDYLTDFVRVVRAVELALGIRCPGVDYSQLFNSNGSLANASTVLEPTSATLPQLSSSTGGRVGDVLTAIIPMIASVAAELGVDNPLGANTTSHSNANTARGFPGGPNRQCLHTTFMDALWQNHGFNPADAVAGPAAFDDHLYFSFGGVAAANPESYLTTVCNIPKVQNDTALGNVPMVFGEWALSTNFNATDEFLTQWADAQKFKYSQSSGWIFWSFKIEDGSSDQPQWDYFTALEAGHFTRDPAALNDPHVCDSFTTSS